MSNHSVQLDDDVDTGPLALAATSARNRCENKQTITIADSLTPQQTNAIGAIDVIKFALDQIKMTQGRLFTGKATEEVSFRKYFASLKRTFMRALESMPRPVLVAIKEQAENLFREYQPLEQIPIFVDELNRLLFDLIAQTTDGEALSAIMLCEFAHDGSHTIVMDGRRALFILLQMYEPVSVNTANIAKKSIESFLFTYDEDAQTQRAVFVQRLSALTKARGNQPVSTVEHWGYLTSAIRGPEWNTFRTVICMQNEFKLCDTAWLLDNIIEHLLSTSSSSTTTDNQAPSSITFSASTGKRHAGLNAATASVTIKDDQLEAIKASMTADVTDAVLAAITTATEVKSRVKKTSNKPFTGWKDCRNCGKHGHRHRDCPTLNTNEPKPEIPRRAGAAKAIDHSVPGFLMAASLKQPPVAKASSSTTWRSLTRSLFSSTACLVIAFIVMISFGNVSFQRNIKVMTTKSDFSTAADVIAAAAAGGTDPGGPFLVDSGASNHICCDATAFSTLDTTISKTFEVVHGDNVTATGVGTIELIADTTDNGLRKLTLDNVYFLPEQRMSLISVDQAIDTSGCDSPDFKQLTWRIDDNTTLKMLKSNGTFPLVATVAARHH